MNGGGYNVFRFSRALGKTPPYAFQVKREEFDELLFRHAASLGVDARQGIRVRSVEFSSDGVTAQAETESGDKFARPRSLSRRCDAGATRSSAAR